MQQELEGERAGGQRARELGRTQGGRGRRRSRMRRRHNLRAAAAHGDAEKRKLAGMEILNCKRIFLQCSSVFMPTLPIAVCEESSIL